MEKADKTGKTRRSHQPRYRRISVGGGRLLKGVEPSDGAARTTFELARRGPGGKRLWAYRHRTGGRGSKRVQRGASLPSRTPATGSNASSSGFDATDGSPAGSRAELVETYLPDA